MPIAEDRAIATDTPAIGEPGNAGADRFIAFVVFLVACLTQAIWLALTPGAETTQTLLGAPVADAYYWHQLASEVALGLGLDTSLRPGYSLLLANVFQVAGNGLAVAKSVNVVLNATTLALSYLVFRRFTRRAVALVATAALASSPTLLLHGHALLSEHAGLTFSMIALLAILAGARSRSAAAWIGAGIATACSNLARPMSLFALPLVAAAMIFEMRRSAWRPVLLLLLATLVTLAPWLAVQKMRNGVWELSANSSEAFFSATSPRHGQWTGNEKTEMVAFGMIGPDAPDAEWNELFKRLAYENLRKHPEVWIGNAARALWKSLNDPGPLARDAPMHALAFAGSMLVFGILVGARSRRTLEPGSADSGRQGIGATAVAAALAVAVLSPLASGAFATALFASAALLLLVDRRAALLFLAYLAGNFLSHATYGMTTHTDRLGLMHAPVIAFLHLYGYYALGVVVGRRRLDGIGAVIRSDAETCRSGTLPGYPAWFDSLSRHRWLGTSLLAALFVLGGLRLGYVNLVAQRAPEAAVDDAQLKRVIDHFAGQLPLTPAEWTGALDAQRTLSRLETPNPAGTVVVRSTRLPYSHIVLSAGGPGPSMQLGHAYYFPSRSYWSLFCGFAVEAHRGERFIAVGRVLPPLSGPLPTLRTLGPVMLLYALVPVDSATGAARIEAAVRLDDRCLR